MTTASKQEKSCCKKLKIRRIQRKNFSIWWVSEVSWVTSWVSRVMEQKIGRNSCSEDKHIAVHSQTRTFFRKLLIASCAFELRVLDCNDKLVKKTTKLASSFDGMFSLPSPEEFSARAKFETLAEKWELRNVLWQLETDRRRKLYRLSWEIHFSSEILCF